MGHGAGQQAGRDARRRTLVLFDELDLVAQHEGTPARPEQRGQRRCGHVEQLVRPTYHTPTIGQTKSHDHSAISSSSDAVHPAPRLRCWCCCCYLTKKGLGWLRILGAADTGEDALRGDDEKDENRPPTPPLLLPPPRIMLHQAVCWRGLTATALALGASLQLRVGEQASQASS